MKYEVTASDGKMTWCNASTYIQAALLALASYAEENDMSRPPLSFDVLNIDNGQRDVITLSSLINIRMAAGKETPELQSI